MEKSIAFNNGRNSRAVKNKSKTRYIQIYYFLPMYKLVKVPKKANLKCLRDISKRKLEDEVDFLHADKHQVSYKLFGDFSHQSFLQGDTIMHY